VKRLLFYSLPSRDIYIYIYPAGICRDRRSGSPILLASCRKSRSRRDVTRARVPRGGGARLGTGTVLLPDVTCNPALARRLINNDTINLARCPLPFVARGAAVALRPEGGERWVREAIKKWASPREGLLRPHPRTFIIFLPEPRKRPALSLSLSLSLSRSLVLCGSRWNRAGELS
jgi:hypothetical protein